MIAGITASVQPAEAGGSFVVSCDNGIGSTSSGWGGYTLRQRIPPEALPATTSVRLTLHGGTPQCDIVKAYAQKAALTGDGYDFKSTPIPVTVGGNVAFSIPGSGGETVTDPIDLTLDGTEAMVISLYFSAGDVGSFAPGIPGTTWGGYYIGIDDAATVDASSYTLGATIFCVRQVEVLA